MTRLSEEVLWKARATHHRPRCDQSAGGRLYLTHTRLLFANALDAHFGHSHWATDLAEIASVTKLEVAVVNGTILFSCALAFFCMWWKYRVLRTWMYGREPEAPIAFHPHWKETETTVDHAARLTRGRRYGIACVISAPLCFVCLIALTNTQSAVLSSALAVVLLFAAAVIALREWWKNT